MNTATATPDALAYAAQILLKAADLLAADPDEPLTRHILDQVMEWADRAVTRTAGAVPPAAFSIAAAALPSIGGATHGAYAAALRATNVEAGERA